MQKCRFLGYGSNMGQITAKTKQNTISWQCLCFGNCWDRFWNNFIRTWYSNIGRSRKHIFYVPTFQKMDWPCIESLATCWALDCLFSPVETLTTRWVLVRLQEMLQARPGFDPYPNITNKSYWFSMFFGPWKNWSENEAGWIRPIGLPRKGN